MAEPMVVADNLHIVYRVYGAGGDRGTAATALLRIVGRKTRGSIREVHAIRGMSFVAYRGGDWTVRQNGYLTLDIRRYSNVALTFVLPVLFLLLAIWVAWQR